MKTIYIPFKETGFFSDLIIDYLNQSEKIESFYNNFSNFEGLKKQLEEKRLVVKQTVRKTLVTVLQNQYRSSTASKKTAQNIQLLGQKNTFTVTTGHQLNLFTGPLYFLYKIISTINLCEELQQHFPKENFVPIYWMATEDHDFEEVNYFNFKNKKVKWNTDETGAVGRFSTKGLQVVFEEFSKYLGASKNATYLKQLFTKGYLEHTNLAAATRYIANELFGKYGLVIIDADNKQLKQAFTPYIKEELLQQTAFNEVSKTIKSLSKNYKIQVNPRELNLFYLTNNMRERIVLENGIYKVNNTTISFSETEILAELEKNPIKFSPNVIMRPLYQEIILPNICYVGGGGELAYWLELKDYFKKVKVPFPVLLLRNSVQTISKKQKLKLEKLHISLNEMFLSQNKLVAKKVNEKSEVNVDFSLYKQTIEKQFLDLRKKALQTDKSFVGAVNAQEKKQLKGLLNLEKRWFRAEKRNQKEYVERIVFLQNELFPNESLEERQRNFSELYLEYGDDFISNLKENLHPLQLEFILLLYHL